jgi:hypothetical protein
MLCACKKRKIAPSDALPVEILTCAAAVPHSLPQKDGLSNYCLTKCGKGLLLSDKKKWGYCTWPSGVLHYEVRCARARLLALRLRGKMPLMHRV